MFFKNNKSRLGAFLGMILVSVMALVLSLNLFGSIGDASAQTTTTAAATTAAATTAGSTTAAGTTAAGGAATSTAGSTIAVFCLDFGKDFPTGQSIKAVGLAPAKVRGALTYAANKGYVTSNPYQVQLAMWNLQDSQPFHDTLNQGTTIAQEIVTNATTAATGDASAISNLTIANVTETSPKGGYGTGTVQGSASTSGAPIGFLLPASAANFQSLVAVVATGSAVAPATTSAATTAAATTAATTTAATTTAATTAATTTAATTAATTTAVATTVAPTTTAAPTTTRATTAAATIGGQGGASAPSSAPATGFGGSDNNSSSMLGLLVMLAGLVGLAFSAMLGLAFAHRKNR